MAKISELPELPEPTGAETVLVLADGEAKRVPLDRVVEAATAPLTAAVSQTPSAEPDFDPHAIARFLDPSGAVAARLLASGIFETRGFSAVDADGVAAVLTAISGAIAMDRLNVAGFALEQADDPGYAFVVTDENGGVLFEVSEVPSIPGDVELDAQMRIVNASKVRFTSRRQAVIMLVVDDLNPTDADVLDMLDERGLKVGFALNTANVSSDTIALYKRAYARGHSILSHSTDATAMSSGATDIAVIESKMADSKAVLESYGFKVSGWVTPSSELHASYFDPLRKHYGYAFTYTNALGWDQTVDPTRLARKGIESLLNADPGIHGGHNVAAVTGDMDAVAAAKYLRGYYIHGVPSAYYTNPDLTPRPSTAEFEQILDHLAWLQQTGAALVLAPDEAMAVYYHTLNF
ncbi:polysaccharide deacetylase family protein [Sphingomonas sp. R647]|uniref:polysaccharide deacetylase family protein n=1 Tax=Sphingomonas sp. R647 TaxID=2875233 RepID=UPI001CD54076|nr:polysaccharide deacetylase family protein [Sphingomonas sp. R647]MCA1199140.1 polysaccharide deacetylase family protein [Sphingomonas sp. R647]